RHEFPARPARRAGGPEPDRRSRICARGAGRRRDRRDDPAACRRAQRRRGTRGAAPRRSDAVDRTPPDPEPRHHGWQHRARRPVGRAAGGDARARRPVPGEERHGRALDPRGRVLQGHARDGPRAGRAAGRNRRAAAPRLERHGVPRNGAPPRRLRAGGGRGRRDARPAGSLPAGEAQPAERGRWAGARERGRKGSRRPEPVGGAAARRGRRGGHARRGSPVRHPRLCRLPPSAGGRAHAPSAGARIRTGATGHVIGTQPSRHAMKIYDLSQPLNERSSFWPYYPPFEVKYIKRKAEHGVNAQYIMTSNHMGTHIDAPRHFVTAGKTIDELPLEWLCGPGVIVDLRDEMDELAVYTPQMIEQRVKVKPGDLLLLHTGWHRYADFGATPDEERYYHYHPGAHPDLVPWLLEKKIHVWGVDCVSTDHPMNLPIGRFLGKGAHGQCDKVRAKAEQKFGGKAAVDKMFPDSAYQLTHNALFPKDCIHIENLGGELEAPELQNQRLI